MQSLFFHSLKKAPFLKLLLAYVSGIIIHWHLQPQVILWWIISATSSFIIFIFFFLRFSLRFRFALLNTIAVFFLFISFGGWLAYQHDTRNDKKWFANNYSPGDILLVSLDEPTVEKTKSLKANAIVQSIIKSDQSLAAKGKIILYFKKDSIDHLDYGSQILIAKPLQEIKNAGNPGGFDYKRYSLFQGITHQVYLKPGEYKVINNKQQQWLKQFIYNSRASVLNILKTYIKSPKELGLAEALLIGYKDDLDQALVQSYTNTGVVHVIAISGLHLGLIYWLLVRLFKPVSKRKRWKWLSIIGIIAGLWLFSLLAGAQPSVLRSAVMFTCIVIGEGLTRRTSIFNTLALSAFILLCINPYWLWDVGFQLSYAAVTSIVLFMQPIYNWINFQNKALDFLWKLTAVTLAAQIFTTPLSIYHFHQFPTYFILTNFIAVPLSSIILIGEIALCFVSLVPVLADITGKVLTWLIWLMNSYIEKIESLSFSLWDGMQITILQTIVLLIAASSICYWLIEKSKRSFATGLIAITVFFSLRAFSFWKSNNQQKIIVYNVPQKTAIDLVEGRNYFFIGDSSLLADDFARNFHLKPSRIWHRISPKKLPTVYQQGNYISFYGKRILIVDKHLSFGSKEPKDSLDLLIISGNPKLYFTKFSSSYNIQQVVVDGSAPTWKIKYWKKDCDSLKIPFHDVSTKGAFIMNL